MPISISESTGGTSVLGPSVRFKGKLHADEDLQILGRVEGSITHTKYLTICPKGHVTANINGHIIVVKGTVEGDLVAGTSVAVAQSGHLTGDISSPSVSINEGADFNGKVKMETERSSRSMLHSEQRASADGSTENTPAAKGR